MAAMIKAIFPVEKMSHSKKEPGTVEAEVRSSPEAFSGNREMLKNLEQIENQIRKVRDSLERAEKKHASRSGVIEAELLGEKSAATLRYFRAFYEEATKPESGNRYRIGALEEALDGAASAMTIFPDEDKLGERLRAPWLRRYTGNAVRSEWQRVGQYLRKAMEEADKEVTKEDDVRRQVHSPISTE